MTSVLEVKMIECLSAFVAEYLVLVNGATAVVAMVDALLFLLRLRVFACNVLFHVFQMVISPQIYIFFHSQGNSSGKK